MWRIALGRFRGFSLTPTQENPMRLFVAALALAAPLAASAHPVIAKPERNIRPEFDIVSAEIHMEGRNAVFRMKVSGKAGKAKPARNGKLAGSRVFSYVWPTSLDPAEVGFEAKTGILAFAVTSHGDFDDTPLYDENGDGNRGNDGDLWHSHWVVLAPDSACGPKSLKVRDIPAGTKPRMPKTWPGLPIFLDSPGFSPVISDRTVEVMVPFDESSPILNGKYDGVTAALRVNESVHAPLLCVENVFKVASGDLSLPGRVAPAK
jgi:hypothetical protein